MATVTAQVVDVATKDGKSYQGEIVNFEDGRYTIFFDNKLISVEENNIKTIRVITEGKKDQPDESGIFDHIDRLVFKDKDYQSAASLIDSLANKRLSEKEKFYKYVRIAYTEYLKSVVRTRNSKEVLVILDRIFATPDPTFSELRNEAFDQLDSLMAGGSDPVFTMQYAIKLSENCLGAINLNEIEKKKLNFSLRELAGHCRNKKMHFQGSVLLNLLMRLNKDDAQIRTLYVETLELLAQQDYDQQKFAECSDTCFKLLQVDPENAKAMTLVETARFEAVKKEIDAMIAPDAIKALRDYSVLTKNPDYRNWASKEIERLYKQIPSENVDSYEIIKRYFPFEKGRWWKYSFGYGETVLMRITDVKKVEKKERYEVTAVRERSYMGNKARREEVIFYVEKDGVYEKRGDDMEPQIKIPMTPENVIKWESNGIQFKRALKQTELTVMVGETKYENCIAYEQSSTVATAGQPVTYSTIVYYAPNIGIIKVTNTNPALARYDLSIEDYGKE